MRHVTYENTFFGCTAMYREASEAILKMGAAELSVDEWHSDGNVNLRKRLKLYQASRTIHCSFAGASCTTCALLLTCQLQN